MTIKDERDVESVLEARKVEYKRRHNELTNKLRHVYAGLAPQEGSNPCCLFDVLLPNYDGRPSDLLIEVKSSSELPHVRMAIGQLFSYRYSLRSPHTVDLAIVLPARPAPEIIGLLDSLNIGLLWLVEDRLETLTLWLIGLAATLKNG